MVTQINVSPPPPPPSPSSTVSPSSAQDDAIANPKTSASPSSSTAQTNSTPNSATSATQSTPPTDFKSALHAARGKQKPAPTAQTNTDQTKKPAVPVGKAKVQPITKATAATAATKTSEVESEESAEQTEETTDQANENESAGKPAVPANPALQIKAVKIAKKKTATSSEEPETEPGTTELTDPTKNSPIVQEVTPDPEQSSDTGKQQKQPKDSDTKTAEKTAAIQNPTVIVAPIPTKAVIQPHVKTPAKSSDNSVSDRSVTLLKATATPKPVSSAELQPQAPTQFEPAAKPQAHQSAPISPATKSGIKPAKQLQADRSADAGSTSPDTAPDPSITIESDADPTADSDSPSTPAPTATAQQSAPHAAPTLSAALNALSSIPSTHTTESTSSTTQTTPTRSFSEANSDQIVSTIRGQLLPDGGTMQITLHPANLGHVHISVQVSAGSVSATFETTNDQATRLLTHNLSQLKQTLESAGVSVEKLQVQQMRDPQPQNQNDSKDQSQQQNSATDQRSAQQEQQRREILQQMWDKISGNQDWVDVKA